MEYFARIDGNLITEERKTYFYHTDHLGSTVLVTDELGQTVWSSEYTPFGQITKDDPGFNKAIKFTGKDLDLETGLYYFNARWYDSDIGRFISEDPIKDGLNWYTYAISNPLRFVDPSGLKYIPLRETAEADGFVVDWDPDTSKASISRKKTRLEYYHRDRKGSFLHPTEGKMYVWDETYLEDTDPSNWVIDLLMDSIGNVRSNLLYDSRLSVAELNRRWNAGIAIVYGGTFEHTIMHGAAKCSYTLTITIKPDPNSPWHLGTDGSLSFDSPHFKMRINRGGQMTLSNDNITTSYKYGNFGTEAELGFNFIQEITNGDLKMKTSTQPLPSLSWGPTMNAAGGYVPTTTQKFEISDQQGYLTIESEMTNYIHRNFRDGMYAAGAFVPVVNGAYELSALIIKILIEGARIPRTVPFN